MDALVDREPDVVHDDVGMGEIDQHLGTTVGDAEQPVAGVNGRDEVQIVSRDDRLADLLAHPSARAEHTDPDRFGHCFSVHTAPSNAC